MDTPDYSQHTEQQLRQILGRIDAARFPERVQEIEARLASLALAPAPVKTEAVAADAPDVVMAGVWRRIVACLIDGMLLFLIGQAAGLVLYQQFSSLGGWGVLVGAFITLLYFGVTQSRLGGGQSAGMRLLGLKVVSRTGEMLGFPAACVRAALFCLVFFLNGVVIDLGADRELLSMGLLLLLFGLVFSIFYLLVFNRRTRQATHDLAVGAFVVRAGPGKLSLPSKAIWRGHAAFIAAVIIVFAGVALVLRQSAIKAELGALNAALTQLQATPGVQGASIFLMTMHTGNQTSEHLSINAIVDASLPDTGAFAQGLVQTVLDSYPGASRQPWIIVSLRSGYNIGIASRWNITNYAHTPEQWKSLGHDTATKTAQ
ncbi:MULTISPECIES: RDD family protein [unclassified Janthinobacterium]|uniref:RDD family protein n=1 Tax=unclassified Janthinobacterium TaxID=2610881 RepID=UPI00160D2180|nr:MULTISPECIES: RDD family protein [unclassified Janthinobacterium]MBB5607231.1 putative RDD family membrane protein YckC [Janthinobacterium sp. S3T4]MBB5612956.1 putative RDD family membrane protein YckC [Janthinobacterium sp. S3M3]